MLTLHNFEMFAVARDGHIVSLGCTASFTFWGAENVARKKVRIMTNVKRSSLGLVKNSHVFVKTWLAEIDK